MTSDLRELIDLSLWQQGSLLEVAALLPEDDSELATLIDEMIAASDSRAFCFVVGGALCAERKVAARHIARSAQLVPEMHLLGAVICHLQPDEQMPELLIEASKQMMPQELKIVCLFLAAQWCREHRDGVCPADLLVQARIQSRSKQLKSVTQGLLLGVLAIVKDEGLKRMLCGENATKADAMQKASSDLAVGALRIWKNPLLGSIQEKDDTWGAGSARRAVAKIGRNDKCHCGSGLKHKRCCMEKDAKRLRMSTRVEGKTVAELIAEPEPHLTHELLKNTAPHELVRFDVRKVPPALVPWFFYYAGSYGLLDKVAESFELLGRPLEFEQTWIDIQMFATKSWRPDLAGRLLAVRGDTPECRADCVPGFRLLLASHDPAAYLEALEEEALMRLKEDDLDESFFLGFALLASPHKALGILVARSLIPLVKKSAAVNLLDGILKARDLLQLTIDDPVSDLLDRRFADEVQDQGQDAHALRKARTKLAAKTDEARKMQVQINALRHDIEQREHAASERAKTEAARAQIKPAALPVDPKILQDLRAKVEALKGHLNEQHHERAGLRRDLQKTYAELQEARRRQPAAPNGKADDAAADLREEALLLPGDVEGINQPVRLIDFPRHFRDTLGYLPNQVARATLALLGRLAAGEPAAFVGVVRLKECADTLRVRIGIDHRLLFRLDADAVHVVDLINRRDLEKRIKALRQGH